MITNYQSGKETSRQDWVLNVDKFSGPLDLLWTLIKKSKIDITEIPLASITEQYLKFLKMMEEQNISIASEFIWMASELLYYKSIALLPAEEIEDEYFTPPLPPELIEKLLEYKKYQQASIELKEQFDLRVNSFPRVNNSDSEEKIELTNIPLFSFLKIMADLLEAKQSAEKQGEIIFDEILVSDRIDFISSLLEKKESFLFQDLFQQQFNPIFIIASFLAILEMSKIKKVKLFQNRSFGDILIKKRLLETKTNF